MHPILIEVHRLSSSLRLIASSQLVDQPHSTADSVTGPRRLKPALRAVRISRRHPKPADRSGSCPASRCRTTRFHRRSGTFQLTPHLAPKIGRNGSCGCFRVVDAQVRTAESYEAIRTAFVVYRLLRFHIRRALGEEPGRGAVVMRKAQRRRG